MSKTEAELRVAGKVANPNAKRVLTCYHHRDLRWSTKRQAGRSIFFLGRVTDPPVYHDDFSGLVCEAAGVAECACPGSHLILAPEDRVMCPDLYSTETETER